MLAAAHVEAVYFRCDPDNPQMEKYCSSTSQSCVTHRLSTHLGSAVLLPCNFTGNSSKVLWIQSPAFAVVTVTSGGRVNFSDPRSGRIKAFPNQGSRGNFSISIDRVNSTDLGCYKCVSRDTCVQVELALETVKGNKETEENDFITAHDANEDLSPPTQESGRVPGDGQQEETQPPRSPDYVNSTVYENDNNIEDDDEPDYLNEIPGRSGTNKQEEEDSHVEHFNFERILSQRTKHRFHSELLNRLRPSSRKHYYVNQDEFRNQQKTVPPKEKKKTKPYEQYPNPIYNRSTDELHQL
ncbi:hypothetical protein WMY93_029373 [Mugilogobius chulae]|uniref:Ig-like domain-containing protein n=1 Tax=Mugilogobius chulae TaxID=88201 RepID=A0AAW0MV76_9GOBI